MKIQICKCRGRKSEGTWGNDCDRLFIRTDKEESCPNGCAEDWFLVREIEINEITKEVGIWQTA